MDNLSINSIDVSPDLMERTNPVFNTAKMTLDQLAFSGDKYAAAISEKLGFNVDETQTSANTKTSPTEMLVGSIVMETRFRTAQELAIASGYKTIVDLPCGYTPHAVYYTEAGRNFVGLDLPAAISEAESAIRSQIHDGKQKQAAFFGVDATNYDSLEKALSGVDGEVCITTEGMIMYFNESEAGALCDNIRNILRSHGGCWINADIEVAKQHLSTLVAIIGEEMFAKIRQNSLKKVEDKSDIKMTGNPLLCGVSPDMKDDIEKASAFLASHGLKYERMIIADHMPELRSLSELSAEQKARVTGALKNAAFWKITLAEKTDRHDTGHISAEKFDVRADISGTALELQLTGRMDSITAPKLLGFYEKTAAEHRINAVRIDCTNLEYISSAGLRVLLIMHKGSENGVVMQNVSPTVTEILVQTGFDTIFNIDKA